MRKLAVLLIVLALLAGSSGAAGAGEPVPPDPIVPICDDGVQWVAPPAPLEMTFQPRDEYSKICQVSVYANGTITTHITDSPGISGLGTHSIRVDDPGEIVYIYASGPYPWRMFIPALTR